MEWLVTVEDKHGVVRGDPEWFTDAASAIEYGKGIRELPFGHAVVLYRVKQDRVLQEAST